MKHVIYIGLIIVAFYVGVIGGIEHQKRIAVWSGAARETTQGEIEYIDSQFLLYRLSQVDDGKPDPVIP